MRVSLLIIIIMAPFVGLLGAPVPGHAQDDRLDKINVELSEQNVPLKQVLEKLEQQTGLTFGYSHAYLDLERNVNVAPIPGKATMSLQDVLEQIFAGTRTTWALSGNVVQLKTWPEPSPKQQTGVITGTITDVETSDPMPGATVQIKGTNRGVTADRNGKYSMEDVRPGIYTLLFSFLGYQQTEVEVEVHSDRITELDVALPLSTSQLEEVVVRAEYAPIINSTEISMVQTIAETPGIVTGISNMQISQSLDSDAGQVVKRVPGVSVFNDFVLVRGMNPRYNVTMLNGMILPSSEMDTRAFRFDLIPAGVIDDIIVHKTASPDLPGNFGGGVIKVNTKNTSVARRLQVSFSGKYRPGSGFTDHIGYKGSSKDWYGGGVEDRQLPAILLDPDYSLPPVRDYPDEVLSIARQLPPLRLPQREYHDLDKSGGINYHDSWKLGSTRLSNLTSVNYSTKRQFYDKTRWNNRSKVAPNEKGEFTYYHDINNNSDDTFGFTDMLYTQSIRISGMENLTLAISDDHQVAFNSFFNRSGKDELLIRRPDLRRGRTYATKYTLQNIYQAQLAGSHRFSSHRLEWSAGLNRVTEEVPDLQRSFYTRAGDRWAYHVGNIDNGRATFETDEKGQVYKLDYSKSFGKDNQKGSVKTGGYLEQREREFYAYRYEVSGKGFELPASPEPWNEPYQEYFTYDPESANGFWIETYTFNGPGRYSIEDDVRAGYVAAEFPFFDNKLKVNGGLRYEWNERYLYDENGSTVDSVKIDASTYVKTPDKVQDFWLPSVSVNYNYTPKSTVRVAYSKTIDRPQYREQSNFAYFDYEAGYTIEPNALLENAEIDNYDLRWEHYPGASEFIAIGAFYKRIYNAIEKRTITKTGAKYPTVRYINSTRADVYGIEAEVRKNLAFISPSLQQFSVIFNGALLQSKVDAEQGLGSASKAFDDRPMQGASPYLVNFGLYFDNKSRGTKAALMYNVTGPRMAQAPNYSGYITGGLFELERHLLDLTLSQQVGKYLTLKAGVRNLLNAPVRFIRDGNLNQKYNGINEDPRQEGQAGYFNDFIENEYREGASYSLGFKFSF